MAFAATGNQGHTKSSGGVANVSVTLTGLTAGNLIRVCGNGFGSSLLSFTASDATNNIAYTLVGFYKNTNENICVSEFWGLAHSSGSITFMIVPNVTADCEIGACEYSFTLGATISTSTAVMNGSAGGSTSSFTTTAVTYSNTDNWLLCGNFIQTGTGAWTAGTNFTARVSDNTAAFYNMLMEDYVTTQATSPLAATCTVATAAAYAGIGVAYREQVNNISPNPNTIPANHSNPIMLLLTGINTTWTSGTVFTANGAGVTLVGTPVITSNTSASITVTTSGSTGTCTLGDGTYTSASLNVATATISVAPNGGGKLLSNPVVMTGVNTLWASETASTLFSASGIPGVSISNIVVNSNTSANINFVASTSIGVATITDNSTEATVNFTIYNSQPGFTATPNNIPVSTTGQVITLAGLGTNWVAGSTSQFTLVNPPSGTSITSQLVSSSNPLSATVTITTSTTAGSCTISDGNYSTPLTVSGPVISTAYVGRSPQLAYFFTTILGSQTNIIDVNSNPTIYSNGVSVTIAGPIWSNTANSMSFLAYQLICGHVQNVLVQNRGYGYTSPTASSTGGVTLGTPTLLNGGLNISGSSFISNGGSGYTQGGALIATDSSGKGSGFVGFAVMSGGAMTSILVEDKGINYNSGTTTLALSTEFGLGGTGAVFVAPTTGNGGIVNGMIGTIPIVSTPTNLTSAPTITVSGGGSGCVAVAEMSGPSPTDVVTFSASAAWLTTRIGTSGTGTVPAATNVAMANYSGQVEPEFVVTPTMPLGCNIVFPFGYGGGKSILQNILKSIQAPFSGCSNPTITSITDATGSLAVIWGVVNSAGQITSWVVQCGGYNFTGPTAAVVSAPQTGGVTATLTGANFTVVNGVITAVSVGTPGSGYGGSTIDGQPIAMNNNKDVANISTGGFAGCNIEVQDNTIGGENGVDGIGNPDMSGIWTYIADESNATNPMTVRMYSAAQSIFFYNGDAYGSKYVPGVLTNGVLVGSTWTFNVTRLAGNTGRLYLYLDFVAGVSGIAAPWSHSNAFLTQPIRGTGAAQPPNRSNAMTPDANMVAWLTLGSTSGFSVIRCWPFQDFQWWNNVVDASDLRNPNDFTYGDSSYRYPYVTIMAIRSYNIWSGCTFTGTLTSNSATVSSILNTTGMAIGQAVTGTGIPAGTAIASIVNSSSITLGVHTAFSGVTTNSSNSITGITSTTGMTTGYIIYGTNIPSGTTIASVVNSTSITISANATGSGTETLYYVAPFSATSSGSQTLGYNSPYVWTENGSYPNVLPTSGLSSGTISAYWGTTTPPAYYWIPQGNSSSNSLDWMGKGISSSHELAWEFVTAAPHGLKSGQQIYELPSNSFTNNIPTRDPNANSGVGTFLTISASGLFLSVWVTSSTTFAVTTQYSGNITVGHVANVAGSNAIAFNLPFRTAPGTNAHPYEAFCNLANAVPGCSLYTFAPPFATDACLTTFLNVIKSILISGRQLYLESINEHWNSSGGQGSNYQNMYTLSGLAAGADSITAGNSDAWYAWWTGHVHQMVDNLGISQFRIFGAQAGVQPTQQIAYLNTYNGSSPTYPIKVDAFTSAPYIDMTTDSTITAAAAAVYSNWIGSTAYETANPWTMGMYLDFCKHFVYLESAKWITSNTSVLSTFNIALSGQTNAPVAITYEGSIQTLVQYGVSTTDPFMRGALAHDGYFHPYMSDLDTALHISNQNAGCALEISFDIQNVRHAATGVSSVINGTTDANGAIVWGATTWTGMAAGLGNGTVDENGNNTVNTYYNSAFNPLSNGGVSQDLANVSPKLASWRAWQSGVNPPPPPPPVAPGVIMFEGPTSGYNGVASTSFTVIPTASLTGTAYPSDGSAGGTFTPATLTFNASSVPQTFTYTPAIPGLITITLRFLPIPTGISGSPIYYQSNIPPATIAMLSGPTVAQVAFGISGFTVSFNGNYAGTVIPSDSGAGGKFIPSSMASTGTQNSVHFGYIPSTVGTKSISITTSPALTIQGSPISLTATALPTYSLSGPSSGYIYTDSASFALAPNGNVPDDIVTLSDNGAGGVFHPYNQFYTSLTWTNSNNTMYFKYNPAISGTITITATSKNGSAISGSPFTYTSNPNPLSPPYNPFPYP